MGDFFGSKQSDTQNVVTTNDLPEWQKPYVQNAYQQAQNIYNNRSNVGQDIYGSQSFGDANNAAQLNRTLSGDYLYGGSGFNAALDAAARRILPQIAGQYALAGHGTQSSRRDLEQTQALSDAFASQYGQERQNQLQASSLLPQLYQSQLSRGDFANQEDQRAINNYAAIISGNVGGTQNNQTPIYQNQGASGLGGALAGSKLGATFGPIGAGVGAIGGGLLGLFG